MGTNTLKMRSQQKRDTVANWRKVERTFYPLPGEIIVYTDVADDENPRKVHSKIKIGDGKTCLADLSFVQVRVRATLGTSENDTMSQKAITDSIHNISKDIDSLMEGLILDGGGVEPNSSLQAGLLDGGNAARQRPNNIPDPEASNANVIEY